MLLVPKPATFPFGELVLILAVNVPQHPLVLRGHSEQPVRAASSPLKAFGAPGRRHGPTPRFKNHPFLGTIIFRISPLTLLGTNIKKKMTTLMVTRLVFCLLSPGRIL